MLLRFRMQGAAVKNLQSQLNELGAKPRLEEDGDFGPATKAAVVIFQKSQGIDADGIVGPVTQSAINDAMRMAPGRDNRESRRADLIAIRDKMLDLIESTVGCLYVYGAQGQTDIARVVDWSARCFPAYTTPARAKRMKTYAAENPKLPNGQPLRAMDCSGLFWWAENESGLLTADDATAAGLYKTYCDPISKTALEPLDLVFNADLTHVGVVGRGGKVYEAAGSDIGVVCNDSVDDRVMPSVYGVAYGCAAKYSKGRWAKYGHLKIFGDAGL